MFSYSHSSTFTHTPAHHSFTHFYAFYSFNPFCSIPLRYVPSICLFALLALGSLLLTVTITSKQFYVLCVCFSQSCFAHYGICNTAAAKWRLSRGLYSTLWPTRYIATMASQQSDTLAGAAHGKGFAKSSVGLQKMENSTDTPSQAMAISRGNYHTTNFNTGCKFVIELWFLFLSQIQRTSSYSISTQTRICFHSFNSSITFSLLLPFD